MLDTDNNQISKINAIFVQKNFLAVGKSIINIKIFCVMWYDVKKCDLSSIRHYDDSKYERMKIDATYK